MHLHKILNLANRASQASRIFRAISQSKTLALFQPNTSRNVLVNALSTQASRHWLNYNAEMSNQTNSKTFILDFDGTITKKDTINAIFKSVLEFQNSRGKDRTEAWKDIVAKYLKDYEAHIQAYNPTEGERSTPAEEIQFYRSLREVEVKSFDRVSESGIFSGISEEEFKDLGRQAVQDGNVVIRDGFEQFLLHINESKAEWAIVSVNFSSAFIRGVLSYVKRDADILIISNQPDAQGVLKGHRGKVMATSDAKLEAARDLIKPMGGASGSRAVYIGDSGTDIECLLADGVIGLVISEDRQSTLLKTMRRIKMNVVHVAEYDENAVRTVYWARDYLEILQSPLLR